MLSGFAPRFNPQARLISAVITAVVAGHASHHTQVAARTQGWFGFQAHEIPDFAAQGFIHRPAAMGDAGELFDHRFGVRRFGDITTHQAAGGPGFLGFGIQLQGVAFVVGTGAPQNQGRHAADLDQVAERIHIPGVWDLERISTDLHCHAGTQGEDLDDIGTGHLPAVGQRLDDTGQPGPAALIDKPGALVHAEGFHFVAVSQEQINRDGGGAQDQGLLRGDDFLVDEQPLRHGISHVGGAQAGHIHPVCPHDQGRASAPLEEGSQSQGLTGGQQNTVYTASNHGLGDRAQVDNVGGDIAHIAVVGGHANRPPITVAIEQAVYASMQSGFHVTPPPFHAPAPSRLGGFLAGHRLRKCPHPARNPPRPIAGPPPVRVCPGPAPLV